MNSNITIDLAQFLKDFPEFDTVSNPALPQYAPSQINYYLNLAKALVDPQGRTIDLANIMAELFIAHHIVLEALAAREMNAGGIPGVASGSIAGKSAGDVTISYNSVSTAEFDAGHWNYTVYGQRLKRLINIVGMGPIQLNPHGGAGTASGAWAGPRNFDNGSW